ncbi:MAG: hypothetical protein QM296_01935 [Bacillota bacterium]|nr:hypothetical protein [Bacillota bacterium]
MRLPGLWQLTATEAAETAEGILPNYAGDNPFLLVHVVIGVVAVVWLAGRRARRERLGLDARPEFVMMIAWGFAVLLGFSVPARFLGLPFYAWCLIVFAVALFGVDVRRSRADREREGLVVGLRDVLRERRAAERGAAERREAAENRENDDD